MKIVRCWLLIACGVVLIGTATVDGRAQAQIEPAYLNPRLPAEQRAADLVKRMTVEEKASQLVNQARAIPRLNVPAYDWWSEALHGVARNGIATVFPEPIGLAATFDPAAIHQMGIDIGTEARVKHNIAERAGHSNIYEGLDFWSPNINIFRDPRWGRGQETYGEDPFLTGRMGVAFITGMQGDDPRYYRVIATPKHFAVHSGPEPLRHSVNVVVSRHDEEDTYLPAFRAAIIEGKAASIMCAYNQVNGQPACANDFLLQDELRGKWRFNGYVVSDCDAVADIYLGHHFTTNIAAAAAVSLERGTDNDCADYITKVADDSDYLRYVDAVRQGLLPEHDVDLAVERLMTARIKLGMFDPPAMVKYMQTPDSELDSPAHRELALQLARESIVLLKNDGILPLSQTTKKIAVIGPLANQTRVLCGNYNGTPSHALSVLDGIRAQFRSAKVSFAPGTSFLSSESDGKEDGRGRTPITWPTDDTLSTSQALIAAKQADVVIAVLGITSDLEGEEMKVDIPGFKGGDRTSLDLPRPEENLLKALKSTGKPIILVLMNGSALSINWAKRNANAILESWYAGEEGGAAVAESLDGTNNPAGRLPVTFYKDVNQLPPFEDYSMKQRSYRYFHGEPLYPFGFGLSYSTYSYSDLKLSRDRLKAGDPLGIDVDVKNISRRSGDEVAQVYLEFPKLAGAPIRALRGFKRVRISAGETKHVRFELNSRDLSMVNEAGVRVIAAGHYRLNVGGGQPGPGTPSVTSQFTVSGEIKLPD